MNPRTVLVAVLAAATVVVASGCAPTDPVIAPVTRDAGSLQGETVDLVPFTRANVARFTVSSDGSVVAAAD